MESHRQFMIKLHRFLFFFMQQYGNKSTSTYGRQQVYIHRCSLSELCYIITIFFLWRCDPTRVMASSFLRFSRSHTTTYHSRQDSSGRVISSSQRPLPDSTNTHNRRTSMPRVGFEPTISAGERLQTYALDCMATGTGHIITIQRYKINGQSIHIPQNFNLHQQCCKSLKFHCLSC